MGSCRVLEEDPLLRTGAPASSTIMRKKNCWNSQSELAGIRHSGEPAKPTIQPVFGMILNLCIEFFV